MVTVFIALFIASRFFVMGDRRDGGAAGVSPHTHAEGVVRLRERAMVRARTLGLDQRLQRMLAFTGEGE